MSVKKKFVAALLSAVVIFTIAMPSSAFASTVTVQIPACSGAISANPNATLKLPAHRNCYITIYSRAIVHDPRVNFRTGYPSLSSYTLKFYDSNGTCVWNGTQLSGYYATYYVGSNVRKIVITPSSWNIGTPQISYDSY